MSSNTYTCFHNTVSPKIKNNIYNTKSDAHYCISNYDKDYICFDENDVITQCRSVVYSHPEKTLLSYSPGSSITNDHFVQIVDGKWSDMHVDEFIDGTMVNLFYDYRHNKWEIATKRAVGGEYGIFSKDISMKTKCKSVLRMFLDAFQTDGESVADIAALHYFPKSCSYSFVIRHPETSIVHPIDHAALYLIAVYRINRKEYRATAIPHAIFQSWDFLHDMPILFPTRIRVSELSDIHKRLSPLDDNTKTVAGYVATHVETGKRSVFLHPTYVELRRIMKADPHFVYYYLCLMRVDRVKQYIQIFPQFSRTFYQFKDYCDEFIENLHTAYLVKFVWRNNTQISKKYDKYVDAIHREIYIPSLAKSRITITRKIVRDYVISKPPGEILYSLFYDKRYIFAPSKRE